VVKFEVLYCGSLGLIIGLQGGKLNLVALIINYAEFRIKCT